MSDPDPEKTNWVFVGAVILIFIVMIVAVIWFLVQNPQGVLSE